MKTVSLLLALVVAKLVMLWGSSLEVTPTMLVVYLWQDLAVAVGFGLFESVRPRGRSSEGLSWVVYWALLGFVALNVAVVRVLWTPLTLAMARAADGTLTDSIVIYLTVPNLVAIALVLLVGVLVPLELRRREFAIRRPALGMTGLTLLAVLGWVLTPGEETRGLHRNAVVAFVSSCFSRVTAGPTLPPEALRRAIVVATADSSLETLRGCARQRNVVLVLLESTAAAALAPYGAAEDPMPHLSIRARQALRFEHAYATYPESIKGLVSVLDSWTPAVDTCPEDYSSLGQTSFVRRLRAGGYRTALFHSGRFPYLGMEHVIADRGFEVLADAGSISGVHDSSFGVDEVSTVEAILGWVDEVDDERFCLVYMPVAGHHPYDAPEPGPFPGDRAIDSYRNALHYADRALEELFEGLEERGHASDTLFVVLGDHGQAFGEHAGNYGHVFHVYEENVHVPLLVMAPGVIDREWVSSRVTSSVDVAPTILDLLGLPASRGHQGLSALDPRPTLALFFSDYSLGFLGLRDGPWKFILEIESGRRQLFHLEQDPGETRNLALREPELADAYARRVMDWARTRKSLLESAIVAGKRDETAPSKVRAAAHVPR